MKAIIFDFDGVIIDSEKYWPELGQSVLRGIIPTWSQEDQEKLMGHSQHGTYDILVREYNCTLPFAEYQELIERSAIHIYQTTALLMPGILPLLERLSARSVRMSIASSGKGDWIKMAMIRLNISSYFLDITSGDDVPGRSKPRPDIYLLAAEKLGLAPSDCLVIEDSMNGILAAKAAEMYCIALDTEHNAKQDLSAADTHIHHFDELTDERLKILLA